MEKNRPRILVFATGGKKPDEGGSGFQELVEFNRTDPPVLDAEIAAVISNHEFGGVRKRADSLGISFEHWAGPFDAEGYQELVVKYQADFIICSGWLKKVEGLPPTITVNIHPGIAPDFGGSGMFGHHVHEAVIKAFREGKAKQSAITIHFVTPDYDRGPIFFEFPVLIRESDDAESLASRVNEKERAWQAYMLNLVVHGYITYVDEKTIEVDYGIWKAIQQFIPIVKVNVKLRR